jgi:hypothetical protein
MVARRYGLCGGMHVKRWGDYFLEINVFPSIEWQLWIALIIPKYSNPSGYSPLDPP